MVNPIPQSLNFPGGVIDGSQHLYAVRVYYEDTDLSGITYHANYLRWFERARSDLLRMLEIDQRAEIEAGAGKAENWISAELLGCEPGTVSGR